MPAGERGPLRVVVADDVPEQRLMLEVSLSAAGLQVVAMAPNGRAAVEAVRIHRPDIALLDLNMPLTDGLEATRAIRREWPETKIVILSSQLAAEMEAPALAAGADLYLEKGVPLPELVETLEQLAGSRLANALERPRRKPRPVPAQSDEFVSFVVHELRTPVAVIEGFAATLVSSLERFDQETIIATADAIRRSTKNLTALVDSFRDVRALETGTLSLVLDSVDLAEMAAETVSDLRQVTAPHPLHCQSAATVPARLDVVRVRQVIVNLVLNAAKFSPPESPIEVAAGTSNGQAALRVQDRGPGVPLESVPELFDKYTRFNKKVPGTGLGLYLSRGIARAHGGDLVYRPREGGGATFLASFGPLDDDHAQPASA